jgi:hypothetical protein
VAYRRLESTSGVWAVHSRRSDRSRLTHGECSVNQPGVAMPTPGTRRVSGGRRLRRGSAIVAMLVLAAAGCGGGDREPTIPEAQLLPSGPPPAIEAHIRARPWASSKANGQAFGAIWRVETTNPKDRDGRGIDAYNWAGRTCDGVRGGGQTPAAMVRRVHHEGRFTEEGAKVIVAAALRALCPPAQGTSNQPLP